MCSSPAKLHFFFMSVCLYWHGVFIRQVKWMEKRECRHYFCSDLYSMHLKAIFRLNANNIQTKITKTKETVTGSQNGLIVRVLFLVSLLEAFSTLLPGVHKDMASLNCSVLYRRVQNATLHSRRREWWWDLNFSGGLKDKTDFILPQTSRAIFPNSHIFFMLDFNSATSVTPLINDWTVDCLD